MWHIQVPAVLKYLLMIDVISLQPMFTVMRFALVDITSVFTPGNGTTLICACLLKQIPAKKAVMNECRYVEHAST